MKIVFDIETDGLDPTVVWVVATSDVDTGDRRVFVDKDEFKDYLSQADEVIGHNIIGYDIPALEKLWGVDFSELKITDTLVMSRLANPSNQGGHSLENWGTTLGFPKGDFHDWEQLSGKMITYCKQDVAINVMVYKKLTEDLADFNERAITLEHEVAYCMNKQRLNGWLIDERKANILYAQLCEKKQDLIDKVHETFKPLPVFVLLTDLKNKYNTDDMYSKAYRKQLDRGAHWRTPKEWGCIEYPEFNIASRQQIVKYLKHFGWTPTKFTDKGNPMVDESVLKGVTEIPECVLILEYFLISKREAMLKNILGKIASDTRIHGYVNTNGAVTGRMTHSSPNMAQIPAVKKGSDGKVMWGLDGGFGADFRSLFTVNNNYKLVGCDASGLELRMLAHYMNDNDYTNEILHGDIHTKNQLAANLPTRDKSKTFIYAFLYGAGDEKIGTIVGGGSKLGKKVKEDFLNSTPALKRLRERVVRASDKGYIKGLDGRKIWIRSGHAALNFLLQGAGAIVMKKALTILNKRAIMEGLDFKFVGNIHDEFQSEVLTDHAERFGQLAIDSIKEAGQYYDLRCPLDAESKIGNNWAETH